MSITDSVAGIAARWTQEYPRKVSVVSCVLANGAVVVLLFWPDDPFGSLVMYLALGWWLLALASSLVILSRSQRFAIDLRSRDLAAACSAVVWWLAMAVWVVHFFHQDYPWHLLTGIPGILIAVRLVNRPRLALLHLATALFQTLGCIVWLFA